VELAFLHRANFGEEIVERRIAERGRLGCLMLGADQGKTGKLGPGLHGQ